MPRNRPWSKAELVLALALYLRIGASYKTHPDVISLSEILNFCSPPKEKLTPRDFETLAGLP